MALFVIERDRPFGDIEGEVAIGAVIVLPATMRLAEKIVGELLDGVADVDLRSVGLGLVPDRGVDLDLTVRYVDDSVVGR